MTGNDSAKARARPGNAVILDTGGIRITSLPPIIRCVDATPAVGSSSRRPRFEHSQKEQFFRKTQQVHQNVHEIDRQAADPNDWTITHTALQGDRQGSPSHRSPARRPSGPRKREAPRPGEEPMIPDNTLLAELATFLELDTDEDEIAGAACLGNLRLIADAVGATKPE